MRLAVLAGWMAVLVGGHPQGRSGVGPSDVFAVASSSLVDVLSDLRKTFSFGCCELHNSEMISSPKVSDK